MEGEGGSGAHRGGGSRLGAAPRGAAGAERRGEGARSLAAPPGSAKCEVDPSKPGGAGLRAPPRRELGAPRGRPRRSCASGGEGRAGSGAQSLRLQQPGRALLRWVTAPPGCARPPRAVLGPPRLCEQGAPPGSVRFAGCARQLLRPGCAPCPRHLSLSLPKGKKTFGMGSQLSAGAGGRGLSGWRGEITSLKEGTAAAGVGLGSWSEPRGWLQREEAMLLSPLFLHLQEMPKKSFTSSLLSCLSSHKLTA